MKKFLALVIFFVCGAAFSQSMTIDFTWKRSHQCSPVSPALTLTGIPSGTTQLSVLMVDHDMRSFDHGGGFLKNDVGFPKEFIIPEGALKVYKGPCPPNFNSFGHDYEFTVTASDGSNNVLAKAGKKKTFSSKEVKD